MRGIILGFVLLFGFTECMADEFVFVGGFFAYDDNQTRYDYKGLSPNGYLEIKYLHKLDDKIRMAVGIKHESSTAYREEGRGFNGVFGEVEIRIY